MVSEAMIPLLADMNLSSSSLTTLSSAYAFRREKLRPRAGEREQVGGAKRKEGGESLPHPLRIRNGLRRTITRPCRSSARN